MWKHLTLATTDYIERLILLQITINIVQTKTSVRIQDFCCRWVCLHPRPHPVEKPLGSRRFDRRWSRYENSVHVHFSGKSWVIKSLTTRETFWAWKAAILELGKSDTSPLAWRCARCRQGFLGVIVTLWLDVGLGNISILYRYHGMRLDIFKSVRFWIS